MKTDKEVQCTSSDLLWSPKQSPNSEVCISIHLLS